MSDLKLGFGLGPGKRQSLADIEREAAAEIQMRVDAGKPPREDWDALKDRSSLDIDVSQLGQWNAVAPDPAFSEPAMTEPAMTEPPAEDRPARAARKPPARKPAARKSAAPKAAAASKPAARKPTVRQPAARKPAARKSAAAGE